MSDTMQEKEDIVIELQRLEKAKVDNHDSAVRFWSIRWVLGLETEKQYNEYMGR